MKKYSPDEFISLLGDEKAEECELCDKQSFLSWGNVKKDRLERLDNLGKFSDGDNYIERHGYEEFHPDDTNYWSVDAPIAIAYYPYHESKIKKCPLCNAIFLFYVEYAGHAPQKRLRLARKSLVSIHNA